MSTTRSSMLPAVGFVGLGTMGAAMCGRLAQEGLAPVAYDIDPGAAAGPAARGRILAAATCADVGAACDIVILMLPDGKVVRDAVVGREGAPAGLLSKLAPGSIVVDMSSSSPLDTLELADVLAARGVGLVDAPVSGSPAAAGSGGLTIMAGGEDALVARCRPILELLGAVIVTGALGSGHATKALNNMLAAIALAASAEALLVARRFGLDPDLVLDVLNRSTGHNDATENKLRQFVLSRTFASGFKLDLMAKDLRTASELAAATDSPLPLGGACLDLWSAASRRLGPGADNTEVVLELERDAGATLVSGAARGCSQQEAQTMDLQGAHET
jgi:3-hydroxyisobutyrate dehydrogenase